MDGRKLEMLREKYKNGVSSLDIERTADRMLANKDLYLGDLYDSIDYEAERKAARFGELESLVRRLEYMLDLYRVPKAPAGCGIESRILSVLKERDTYVW